MSTFKELIDNKKSLDWEKKLITRLNLAGKRIFFSKSDYPEITDLINSCTNSSIGRGEIVFYYFLSSLKYDIEENHSESNPDLKMNISEDDKLFFEVKLDRRNI